MASTTGFCLVCGKATRVVLDESLITGLLAYGGDNAPQLEVPAGFDVLCEEHAGTDVAKLRAEQEKVAATRDADAAAVAEELVKARGAEERAAAKAKADEEKAAKQAADDAEAAAAKEAADAEKAAKAEEAEKAKAAKAEEKPAPKAAAKPDSEPVRRTPPRRS